MSKKIKVSKSQLDKIIQEELRGMREIKNLEEANNRIDSLIERFEQGEDLSEEELNEFMAGLGAVGKWGQQKAADAASRIGGAVRQASDRATDAVRGVASDVAHQYQKGQRAASINKQRKAVDKQQVANNQKVQDLAARGKAINDQIRKYQSALAQVGQQYEKLTGKKYVPGQAVANAQRYVNERKTNEKKASS